MTLKFANFTAQAEVLKVNPIFQKAQAFAESVGPQNILNISHSNISVTDQQAVVLTIIVWYWDND